MTESPGTLALSRIDTHEQVCAERYRNLADSMVNMAHRIGKLEGLVWGVSGTMIIGMSGLIVTLSMKLSH